MPYVVPEALLAAILAIFVFLALCAALVLVTVSMRRPSNLPLLVAGILIVLSLLAVTVAPRNVPGIAAMIIALLGTALATVGGDPVTRRVLDIATHGTVPEGPRGGILIAGSAQTPGGEEQEILRGGTTIGYLERLGTAVSIIAGFPEAIAVVVAIKGIGRFSELATSAARERFIIGTLASLLWASAVGGLVRLAIW